MIDNSKENSNIISDFKVFEYKAIYDDLINLSDKEALNHYINFGIKEKRYNSFKGLFKDLNLDVLNTFLKNNTETIGKISLLNYVSEEIGLKVSEYKFIYDDLNNLSDQEAKLHFFQFGINEKRYKSYEQIKNQLEKFLSLNLHQVLFEKTSNFVIHKKSKKDFLNLYYHLVDERTQYFAKKNINKFKKDAIFDMFHSFVNGKSFAPFPIEYFLKMFYDILFFKTSNKENNLIFNNNLIKNFIKGKNLELIENNPSRIYVLIIIARIFSVDHSFFSYLLDKSENLIDYYKSLIIFIDSAYKLNLGENIENLLSQYLLLIELYLIKFVPNYPDTILFEKENIIKIRQKAIESSLSLIKSNIIFLDYPEMSIKDILKGLTKLISLNNEYI